MPLIVFPDDVNLWKGGTPVEPPRETALIHAIAAAQSWIEREGGRKSLAKTPVTFTLDSDQARGCCRTDLWLPGEIRPVWHTGADLITLVENGVNITVASGYSASADVLIRGANQDSPVCFYRRGGWYPDKQNLTVTLTCGWDVDSLAAVLPVPEAIRLLIIELAWLFYTGSTKQGKNSISKAGTSVGFEDTLSAMSQSTLNSLRDFGD